jgi:hypothetical protein
MQGREALVRAGVGRIDPERLLALLDGVSEATEAGERSGAVAPAGGIVRAHGERAVVEPERVLETAPVVLVVAGPLDLLRVGGRQGPPDRGVVVVGGGAAAAGAHDVPVAVVGGAGAEDVVAGGARRGGGAGGRQRLGDAAGGADVPGGERVGERRGGGAGAGGEDEGAGAGASVAPARGRVGGERDLARVAPAGGECGGRRRRAGDVAGGAGGGARGEVGPLLGGGVRERGDRGEAARREGVGLVGGGEEDGGGEGVGERVRHWSRRAVGHSSQAGAAGVDLSAQLWVGRGDARAAWNGMGISGSLPRSLVRKEEGMMKKAKDWTLGGRFAGLAAVTNHCAVWFTANVRHATVVAVIFAASA